MSDIQISAAALEAGARALHAKGDWSHISWEELEDCDRDYYKAEARATFTAMVKAWPEAMFANFPEDDKVRVELILPLMENPDEA